MSKEHIENVISRINTEIKFCSKILLENKIPDFASLNDLVADFTESLTKLDESSSSEYSKLLLIWSGELRGIMDNLTSTKNDIQSKLETAMAGNRAFTNYNKLN